MIYYKLFNEVCLEVFMIPRFDHKHPMRLFDYSIQDIETLSDENLSKLAREINKACLFIDKNITLDDFELKKCLDVKNAIISKINRVSRARIIKNDYQSINILCNAIAKNRLQEVEDLLSLLSPSYIERYASQLLEHACSKEMIDLLAQHEIKDVNPETIDKWINGKLELVDCCIKNGMFPRSAMGMKCRRNFIEKECSPYYLPFPHLTKAMHQYSLTVNDESLIGKILNLFAAIDDKEGMGLMLNKHQDANVSSAIEFAIKNCNYEMVELLLNKIEPSADKQHLCSFALKQTGDLKMLRLLGSETLKNIPVLEEYTNADRSLNAQHHKVYGGKGVQEIFLKETKKNIEYALFIMKEAKENKEVIESFKPLLICLGNRRRHIALISESNAALEFGVLRSVPLKTPLHGNYESYKQSSIELIKSTISLSGKEYLLSCLHPEGDQAIFNLHTTFFQENDPVFSHVASLYEKILTTTFESADELKNEIAAFHWLFANISPYNRGSASIAEVLTDAMWLIHGYVPMPIEQGKSLDLEALTSPNMKSYQNAYPMGRLSSTS